MIWAMVYLCVLEAFCIAWLMHVCGLRIAERDEERLRRAAAERALRALRALCDRRGGPRIVEEMDPEDVLPGEY